MVHCDTFPNWYQEWKTYVPLKWDFSDFDDIIDNIGTDEYKKIAKNGYEMYRYYLTSYEARTEFAKHVIKGLNFQ